MTNIVPKMDSPTVTADMMKAFYLQMTAGKNQEEKASLPSAANFRDEPQQGSSRFVKPMEPPPLPSLALLGLSGSLPDMDSQNNPGGGYYVWHPGPNPQSKSDGGMDFQPGLRKQTETVVIKRQTEIFYKDSAPSHCRQTETVFKDTGSAEGNTKFQEQINGLFQDSNVIRPQFDFRQPPPMGAPFVESETNRVQSGSKRQPDMTFVEPRQPRAQPGYQRQCDANLEEEEVSIIRCPPPQMANNQNQTGFPYGEANPPNHHAKFQRPGVAFEEPGLSRDQTGFQREAGTSFVDGAHPLRSQPVGQEQSGIPLAQRSRFQQQPNFGPVGGLRSSGSVYEDSDLPRTQPQSQQHPAKAFDNGWNTQPRVVFEEAWLPRSRPGFQTQPDMGFQSSESIRTQPSLRQPTEITYKEQLLPSRQAGHQQNTNSSFNEPRLIRAPGGIQHLSNMISENPRVVRDPSAISSVQQSGIQSQSEVAAFQAAPPLLHTVIQQPETGARVAMRSTQGIPGLLDIVVGDPRPNANILQQKPRAPISLPKSMEVDFDISHSVLAEPSFKEARDSIFAMPIRTGAFAGESRNALLNRLQEMNNDFGNPRMPTDASYSNLLKRGSFTATFPRFQRGGFPTHTIQRGTTANRFQSSSLATSGMQADHTSVIDINSDGAQFSNWLNRGRSSRQRGSSTSNRFHRGTMNNTSIASGLTSQYGNITSGLSTTRGISRGAGRATSGFHRGGLIDSTNPNLMSLGSSRLREFQNDGREVEVIELDNEESVEAETGIAPSRKRPIEEGPPMKKISTLGFNTMNYEAKKNQNVSPARQTTFYTPDNRYCEVCKVTLNSSIQAKEHYAGSVHAKRASLSLPPRMPAEKPAAEPLASSDEPVQLLPPKKSKNRDSFAPAQKTYFCTVCQCNVFGDKTIAEHLKGERHTVNLSFQELKKAALANCPEGTTPPPPPKVFRCNICRCCMFGVTSASDHRRGDRHKAKLLFKAIEYDEDGLPARIAAEVQLDGTPEASISADPFINEINLETYRFT